MEFSFRGGRKDVDYILRLDGSEQDAKDSAGAKIKATPSLQPDNSIVNNTEMEGKPIVETRRLVDKDTMRIESAFGPTRSVRHYKRQ